MKTRPKNAQAVSTASNKAPCIPALALLTVLLLIFWPAASAKAQSGSASPAQSQSSSQAQSQKGSQAPSQSAAAQTNSATKSESLADAARKATAAKNKSAPKHVYTDDDLSNIHGGISVVGSGSDGDSAGSADSGARPQTNDSAGKDEAYWRGKAHAIKDQIASVDQQINRVKAEIAKSGPAGFDPVTALSSDVVIIHDRNADLQQLQDRKANLERQLDQLADQGRRAGADPGWFR